MANYITVQDVRDAGVTVVEASDTVVLTQITLWQQFIERACRQWFEPRTVNLKCDGNGSDFLPFSVPVISISELKVNNSEAVLDPSRYRVYNANPMPDDRRNPRIRLISYSRDIYTDSVAYGGRSVFLKGGQNQSIIGVFGFVEADGSTPELIKHALLKLVVEKIRSRPGATPTGNSPLVGLILEEWTDGHKIKYSQPGGTTSPRKPGLTGITQDQEILDIIKLYKGPIGIAVASSGWTGEGGW